MEIRGSSDILGSAEILVTQILYPWKRFWCRRGGTISLADQGFLLDPESEYAKYYTTDVVSFEAIANIQCLVLLGEPGIGKSTTLRTEFERVRQAAAAANDVAMYFDLRDYSSDTRLEQKVFKNEAIQSWRDGDHTLHLFLDSLDQGLLWIDNIARVLHTELQDLPLDRLRLRIASRPADWQVTLEQDFLRFWGENGVRIVELAPLRRVDVTLAAKLNSVDDPDRFIQEVLDRDVVPLAIKPVTLRFLLGTYLKDRSLPRSRVELYREGCWRLCDESNPHRRDSREGRGNLAVTQRLAVAARIAAVTQLSNRAAIWFGPTGDLEPEDVSLEALIGTERVGSSEITTDVSALREVLGTGLFWSGGPYRQYWQHQTYAEFLGAFYLDAHRVPVRRLQTLLLHPDGSGKVIPQLREVATWLAGMNIRAFQFIARTNPEILLGSEIAAATHAERAVLAKRLLRAYDTGAASLSVWDHYPSFRRLDNPELTEITRPYISDSGHSRDARIAAIEIVGACQLTSLGGELTSVALSPAENTEIRSHAAAAIVALNDRGARQALRPLAFSQAGADPRDDFKGYGLQATWPDHMTAGELFAILTPPKVQNHLGPYARFLSGPIADQLAPQDLPVALGWARNHAHGRDELDSLHSLASNIMRRAVDYVHQPQVADLLAAALFERAQAYASSDLVTAKLRALGQSAKRAIVRAMLPLAAQSKHGPYFLMDTCAVDPGDLPWLLSELSQALDGAVRHTLAELISRLIDPSDVPTVDAVLCACKTSPELESALQPFTAAIRLGSPLAAELREHYELMMRHDKPAPIAPPVPLEQAVADALAANESDLFFRVDAILTKRQPGSSVIFESWQSLDEERKAQILRAAQDYVKKRPPTPGGSWWKDGQYTWGLLAGYDALRLLAVYSADALDELNEPDWEFWTRLIVSFRGEGNNDPGRPALLSRASRRVRAIFLATVEDVIRGENTRHKDVLLLRQLGDIWNDDLSALFRTELNEPTLEPDSYRAILQKLLTIGDAVAEAQARTMVMGVVPEAGANRRKTVFAAAELLAQDPAQWKAIWPILQTNQAFGVEVLSLVAYEREHNGFATKLDEMDIADICIWLTARGLDDRRQDGLVTPEIALARWWNTLINYLMTKGTVGACQAIRRLIDTLPQYSDGLTHALHVAEDHMRRSTWTPADAQQVLDLGRRELAPPLVISLHGIRTRGAWQKQLNSDLQSLGFRHELLDYGFFRACQLLIPWFRKRQVEWFRREYERLAANVQGPPSAIAHSFGTYIVASALERYAEIRFDRIILCGSIVRRDYDWGALIESGRVDAVLNDYGGRDFWPKAAESTISDGGASGTRGFLMPHPNLYQRYRPQFQHSDYFYALNYRQTWIPFLEGDEPSEVPIAAKPHWNWRFLLMLLLPIAAALLAAYLALKRR